MFGAEATASSEQRSTGDRRMGYGIELMAAEGAR
jgi:hypothetical protein